MNIMKKLHIILIAAAVIFATGCNRLDVAGMVINRSDTEERVADWLDYNAQNGEPVIENAPDEYRIYSCSDSHYSERDSIVTQGANDRLYHYITTMRNDSEALFAIHAGDMVNESGEKGFVMTEEAIRYNPETQTTDKPCFLVIGNHDVYFDCATFQLDWLEKQLSNRDKYRHCFVISHNWLFRTSYNYTTTPAANLPQDEQYAFMELMSRSNVNMVIMGHFHMREQRQFGGVQYVMTDNLNEEVETPSYLVVNVGAKVTYEYQELAEE